MPLLIAYQKYDKAPHSETCQNAIVEVEDSGKIGITIASTGPDSMIRVQAADYGTTSFVIKDGDREYRYTIEVYEDDKGYGQIRITPEG